MKAEEIRRNTEDELETMERDLKMEYFKLRFRFFTGQLENTARMKGVRRDIARVTTILHERKTGGDKSDGGEK